MRRAIDQVDSEEPRAQRPTPGPSASAGGEWVRGVAGRLVWRKRIESHRAGARLPPSEGVEGRADRDVRRGGIVGPSFAPPALSRRQNGVPEQRAQEPRWTPSHVPRDSAACPQRFPMSPPRVNARHATLARDSSRVTSGRPRSLSARRLQRNSCWRESKNVSDAMELHVRALCRSSSCSEKFE